MATHLVDEAGNSISLKNPLPVAWGPAQTFTLLDKASATGEGAVADLDGKFASLAVQVSGTFVGTVSFEASVDGTNFVAIQGTKKSDGTTATSTTTAGLFEFRVNGVNKFRLNVSAYTSGEISAVGTASALPLTL